MPSACCAACAASRRRASPRPTWCGIRWWRASSRRTTPPAARSAEVAVRPELSLSLQFADASHRALLPRHKVSRWMRAALEVPGEIAVRIVDADEGRSLNRDYRGKDYATNVLTFD